MGVSFTFCGLLFLFLAILVPVLLAINTEGDLCAMAESLNLGEQMICYPSDEDETYVAETKSEYASIYSGKRTQLKSNITISRNVTYEAFPSSSLGYYEDYEYEDFSISSSVFFRAELDIYCRGSGCVSASLYFMTNKEFNKAVDSDGYLWTYKIPVAAELDSSFTENVHYDYVLSPPNADVNNMHLVYHNSGYKTAKFYTSGTIYYTVFDPSKFTKATCKSKCEYKEQDKNCFILIDYPKTTYSDPKEAYIAAKIHDMDINWSSVLSCAIIFGIFAIGFLLMAAFIFRKCLKKILKIPKKIMGIFSGSSSSSSSSSNNSLFTESGSSSVDMAKVSQTPDGNPGVTPTAPPPDANAVTPTAPPPEVVVDPSAAVAPVSPVAPVDPVDPSYGQPLVVGEQPPVVAAEQPPAYPGEQPAAAPVDQPAVDPAYPGQPM